MVMNKKIFSLALVVYFSLCSVNLFSQFKYWVRLKDKTGTPYTISNPSAFLTSKSILRRTTYNIPVDASDLPVNPSYVSQIAGVTNVTVLFCSKWLNGVVISVPTRSQAVTALATIKTFSFVLDTTKVKKYNPNIKEPVNTNPQTEVPFARTSSETSGGYNYGGSYWQNKQVNVTCLHDMGFRGQGITIGVMDAGFANVDTYNVFDSLRNRVGILGTRNFADGGTNVYLGSTHGTAVLSCMAGNKPGRTLGSAPLANFWLFRTEEGGETLSEEYNWVRAAEFGDSVGVDMFTTSLGYTDFDYPEMNHTYSTLTGRKAPMSIAANMAARKGIFVLNAAGNEGAGSWHYVSVPGDADSICTVGAIDSLELVPAFSSVGPTADGRIKPELVARGVGAWICDGSFDGYPGNGTSFATPILAGAVACFWQAHRSYNNIQILDTLKKGANNHCSPNNSRGWGLPKMCPVKILIKSSALLSERTSHSGIKVKFIAISSTAQTDSTYTTTDGTYSIYLSAGYYKIVFSKNYFVTEYYNNTANTMLDICYLLSQVTLKPSPGAPEIPFDFTVFADRASLQMSLLLTDAGYEYITIDVYDLNGKHLISREADANATTIQFDIPALTDEIYLIKVKTDKGTKTKKVLKL